MGFRRQPTPHTQRMLRRKQQYSYARVADAVSVAAVPTAAASASTFGAADVAALAISAATAASVEDDQ